MASENKQGVSNYFSRHPRTFSRTAEICLGISRYFIYQTLLNRLYLFPYRLHSVLELAERDYEAPVEFANWSLQNVGSDDSFLNRIAFSNECVFHKDENVSKHNAKIQGSKNLQETK